MRRVTTDADARGPQPAADAAARLAAMSFAMPFRHYQELALEAFEAARARDDRRIYLTMPPGSGKTVLGLEIGRRVARPVVVLAPTTAIQAQWIAQWSSFRPEWPAAAAMTDRRAGPGADLPVAVRPRPRRDGRPDDDDADDERRCRR